MKKSTKITLTIVSVFIVLVAIVLTLMFTLVNTFKFTVMTKSAIERAQTVYVDRMNGDDPVRFIAHRGLSEEGYQNTENAFTLAGQDENIWGIETDVWMTSDGGMVCMHDANALKGVSNVRNVTLQEAVSTPLRNNHDEYAPSIQTYLGICKEYDKVAIIELKDSKMTADDIGILLNFVRQSGARAKIISFHYKLLETVRSQDGEIGLQALAVSGNLLTAKVVKQLISLRCDLSSNYEFLTSSIINKFHGAGLKVGVWTVNSAKDAMCCVGVLGIDYITTDVRMFDEINESFNLSALIA